VCVCVCVVWLTAETRPSDHCPSSDLGLELSLPCATSSLWAAVADFTRALVALAMFFAASRICSSKFRESSAPYVCVCLHVSVWRMLGSYYQSARTRRPDSPNPNPKAHTTLGLGFSSASFLAAASMDAAACRSSVSAMTFGSLTSTQSPTVAIAMK